VNENTPAEAGCDDLSDWSGSPPSTIHAPVAAPGPIRTEEFFRHGRFVARFALPDVDPDRDIDVNTRPGLIIVEARHPIAGGPGIYHLLSSHVYLPAGADDRDVQAIYENGTLDVTIGLGSQPGLANSRC
jgi:HSP20 family protein